MCRLYVLIGYICICNYIRSLAIIDWKYDQMILLFHRVYFKATFENDELSLLLLFLSDPGLVRKYHHARSRKWTFCDHCQSFRPPKTVHCSTCQVCIADYDHHCPVSEFVFRILAQNILLLITYFFLSFHLGMPIISIWPCYHCCGIATDNLLKFGILLLPP